MAWFGVLGLVRSAAVLGVVGVSAAFGQSFADGAASTPPQTVEDALHEMANAAGVIFAGQVLSVRMVQGMGGAPGVVEVTFRVDQAVRGCSAGGTYVLKEWQGLWAANDARYRVGQRLLMLLRTPGASGLSSPVGGMDGAIPIRGVESQIGREAVGAATVAPEPMADLRWVGARMLRTASSGAGLVSGASVGSGPAGVSSVASQGASVGTVVGLLNSWESARAVR